MLKPLSISNILALPRAFKRILVIALDGSLCLLSVWLAFYLRLGEFVWFSNSIFWASTAAAICAIPIFIKSGLYRAIFRYSGWPALVAVLRASFFYSLLYVIVFTFIGFEGVPRTIGIIQPILLVILIIISRTLARFWLGGLYLRQFRLARLPRVLIYGSGSTGRQLAKSLANSSEMHIVGFLDDHAPLKGQILNGLPIYDPNQLSVLVIRKNISTVLLAMPNVTRSRRNEIINTLLKAKVSVRTLPKVNDLNPDLISSNDLQELDIDDLLGREQVEPNDALFKKNILNKIVVVTGAGGSIGSELCRQILNIGPEILLLIEQNELALYRIHQELVLKFPTYTTRVIPLLASVCDEARVSSIFLAWRPNTIYHTAAYKHVPIVEHNPADGIKNNVFGTLTVCKAALTANVESFVLISTDKAVRPTNIMGASKRLAEMILQALSVNSHPTKFAIVRFGNVLGSSGSVVPKFRQQIDTGGPITVTHPEIIRYFMTIPEAAQLVIQAGALACGGDVFVLDMGHPVKIIDLAVRMIELSGRTIKNENNPDGDIEVAVTGLRPGEKLFEELLIGNNPKETIHPRIMTAREEFLPWELLHAELEELAKLLNNHNIVAIQHKLQLLNLNYNPADAIVDWLHLRNHSGDSV